MAIEDVTLTPLAALRDILHRRAISVANGA